jgi:hypothetical protein
MATHMGMASSTCQGILRALNTSCRTKASGYRCSSIKFAVPVTNEVLPGCLLWTACKVDRTAVRHSCPERLLDTGAKGSSTMHAMLECCSGTHAVAALYVSARPVQGARHGHGTQHFPNGEVYTGSFAQNKRQGYGRMAYANGDVYEGFWEGDRRDGAGRLLDRGGDVVFEGSFINGVREGQGCLLRLSKVPHLKVISCLFIALWLMAQGQRIASAS